VPTELGDVTDVLVVEPHDIWLALALAAVSLVASAHIILHKRDSRAAVAWLGAVWVLPGVGAILYLLLGLNRIKRRALELREQRATTPLTVEHPSARVDADAFFVTHQDLKPLATLGDRLSGRPLLRGNAVLPLVNGDEAYPAMLAAIEGATRTVVMSSYIFAGDGIGRQFAEALGRAVTRGVAVRVLIDDVGRFYSWPSVYGALRRAQVPTARFLPLLSATGSAFFNLRNHRKVLVVDGQVAFSGGMNIRDAHMIKDPRGGATLDVHFRLEGPIAMQLLASFAEDWAFVTRESLEGPLWHTEPVPQGETIARTITNGPDDDFEVVRHVILGAIASARTSIDIVTPYFLPDAGIITALVVAALRGVRVRIVIPQHGNIALVRWATPAILWQLLKPGCEVYFSPRPFDHAKMFVVDGTWSLLGSTNWDPRSLRLNFELDVECYCAEFASTVGTIIDERVRTARRVTLAEMDGRPLWRRLRDGIARFAPYL
jgi:cardiolipin synthase